MWDVGCGMLGRQGRLVNIASHTLRAGLQPSSSLLDFYFMAPFPELVWEACTLPLQFFHSHGTICVLCKGFTGLEIIRVGQKQYRYIQCIHGNLLQGFDQLYGHIRFVCKQFWPALEMKAHKNAYHNCQGVL
jgi:hypothetical protein